MVNATTKKGPRLREGLMQDTAPLRKNLGHFEDEASLAGWASNATTPVVFPFAGFAQQMILDALGQMIFLAEQAS